MAGNDREGVLALATSLQALTQVARIATHGHGDHRRMEAPLRLLLGRYDGDMEHLIGGRENVNDGLRLLADHLRQPRDAHLTRHLVAALALERKLTRHRRAFPEVVNGLEAASRQADYFGSVLHANVLDNVGDLYSRTVSHLRPRILVQGDRTFLEDPRNAAAIRSLLLAAIRGISFWRQDGGSRFQLIFRRGHLISTARSLMATV